MLRVLRLQGASAPRFLTQHAAIWGYQKQERFRRCAEVRLSNRHDEVHASGMRFDEATRTDFLAGTFDFAAELPPKRGDQNERAEWEEALDFYRRHWTDLSALIESVVGPDLDDQIAELRDVDLGDVKSWVYPIECATMTSIEWWCLGLAGSGEEILLFHGSPLMYARHLNGWEIPGIGKVPRTKSRKDYPFADTKIREVYTWLAPDEHALPIAGEKLFRRTELTGK